MGCKTRGQRACAQTLAIARQKCLDNRMGGPSVDPGAGRVDPEAGRVDPETAGNGGSFPNVGPNDSVDIEVDNSPGDGADPNDLSDGSDEPDDLDLLGSSNTAATADRTMSGGPMEEDEDDNEIVVLPGPVDRARYRGGGIDEGSNVAGDVEGPDLVAPTRHERAEEEEKSDEAEGPREGGNRAMSSVRSGWADLDEVSRGAAKIRGPGRVAFT
ncbi:hypothetical protein H4582DRAFT_2058826 [Lactarius indigo]|nr:hypothetical protein H4582DRAFT_2058826 [Lactarius indigo]